MKDDLRTFIIDILCCIVQIWPKQQTNTLFFTGVDEVTSRFTTIDLNGPKLLTVERGVEKVRQAFFEGNIMRNITTSGRALGQQWIINLIDTKLCN